MISPYLSCLGKFHFRNVEEESKVNAFKISMPNCKKSIQNAVEEAQIGYIKLKKKFGTKEIVLW